MVCPIVRDSAFQAPLDSGITVQSNGVDYLYCTFYSYGTNGQLLFQLISTLGRRPQPSCTFL